MNPIRHSRYLNIFTGIQEFYSVTGSHLLKERPQLPRSSILWRKRILGSHYRYRSNDQNLWYTVAVPFLLRVTAQLNHLYQFLHIGRNFCRCLMEPHLDIISPQHNYHHIKRNMALDKRHQGWSAVKIQLILDGLIQAIVIVILPGSTTGKTFFNNSILFAQFLLQHPWPAYITWPPLDSWSLGEAPGIGIPIAHNADFFPRTAHGRKARGTGAQNQQAHRQNYRNFLKHTHHTPYFL